MHPQAVHLTSTNVHHLTEARCQALIEAGLSRLIVSIDGLTQDTYASYRVGHVGKVMEGTQNMVRAKRNCGRGRTSCGSFGGRPQRTRAARASAGQRGVDEVEVKTAQLDDPVTHTLCSPKPRSTGGDRDP